jgi:hypothetical protein
MDQEKFSNLQVRANGAWNIEITTQEIDPRYTVIPSTVSKTSDTGHLEVFRIKPVQAGPPIFSARWDMKPNTIDLDLIGDPAANRTFRAETGGYSGHHTTVVRDSPREFGVDVRTPDGCVFRGTVMLNIGLGVRLKDSFTCTDCAQAEVIAAPKKEAQ